MRALQAELRPSAELEPLVERQSPSLAASRLEPWHVALGVVFLLVAGLAALMVGPSDLSPLSVLEEVVSRLPFVHLHPGLPADGAAVVWQLRLPRIVLAGVVGATLALAGASYQGVFQNPLADPYLLGVASGAGLGATVAVVVIPNRASWAVDPVPVAAFAGAILAVAATFALGRGGGRTRSASSLVLAGVAVAAFFTAVQTFLQQRNNPAVVQQIYSWILGGLPTAGWGQVSLVMPYIALSAVVLLACRRLLDVMAVGDEEAGSLGVRADRVRLAVILAATLGTAAAVSVSGLIGFVGIIVPHTIRLIAGSSYRRILPLSVLFGGGFLILADLVARTALSPGELPLGVVTAFLGAPFFLVVLRQSRRLT